MNSHLFIPPPAPVFLRLVPHSDWGRLAQVADVENLLHLSASERVAFLLLTKQLCSKFLTLAFFYLTATVSPFSVFVSVWFGRMKPPVSPIMTLYLVRQRVKFVCGRLAMLVCKPSSSADISKDKTPPVAACVASERCFRVELKYLWPFSL